MSRRVAIVGFGQTEMRSRIPTMSKAELAHQAVKRALDDAQLTMKDIDEVIIPDIEHFSAESEAEMWLSDCTGSYMKPIMKFETGGTVGGSACHSAVHHIAAGASDVVLVSGTAKFVQPPEKYPMGTYTQLLLSAGMHPVLEKWCAMGAVGGFAMMARVYMVLSGCTEEAVAKCRVKAANNAVKNPFAHLRRPLTVKDVIESPMLMSPLRLLHMCPTTEGSAALIFASEDKAQKITEKPVWVKDMVTLHSSQYLAGLEEPSGKVTRITLPSLVLASKILYKRNGVTDPAKQLDVVEMYEPCTWAELIWTESMGLCKPNEAWKLVEEGATEITGQIPVNPSGGVTATNPGIPSTMIRYGEVALQIRGDAGEHQIPGEVKLGVSTGFGGTGWTPLMLLSKEK